MKVGGVTVLTPGVGDSGVAAAFFVVQLWDWVALLFLPKGSAAF